MKIQEKLFMDKSQLEKEGPITIVAFGDSVTHGAVAPGEIDYETVFWNRLKKKLNAVRNYVPINVINAGIGGTTAKASVKRLDSQVLAYNPDLIIVSFGLNDVNGELEDYLEPLKTIFTKCKQSGAEVIFLSPNMLNTYVAEGTPEEYLDYAKKTADMQNLGRMDLYINSAIEIAKQLSVTVCDCYGKWKELSKTTDTTMLLANRINHPTKDMHELFAQSLFEIIMPTEQNSNVDDNTMYNG